MIQSVLWWNISLNRLINFHEPEPKWKQSLRVKYLAISLRLSVILLNSTRFLVTINCPPFCFLFPPILNLPPPYLTDSTRFLVTINRRSPLSTEYDNNLPTMRWGRFTKPCKHMNYSWIYTPSVVIGRRCHWHTSVLLYRWLGSTKVLDAVIPSHWNLSINLMDIFTLYIILVKFKHFLV